MVTVSIFSPHDLNGQPRNRRTLIIQSIKPEYDGKQYFFVLYQGIKGRVRITMKQMPSRGMDLINTQYDTWFEDPFWDSNPEWFECLQGDKKR
jgi:hypothetical protein